MLYVQGPDEARHLVDGGTRYRVAGAKKDRGTLLNALVGGRQPQPVTADWLATLHEGTPIAFPNSRHPRRRRRGPGLATADNRVGMVLRATTGSGLPALRGAARQGQARLEFTAWLLINAPENGQLHMTGRAREVDMQSLAPATGFLRGRRPLAPDKTQQVNTAPEAGGGLDSGSGAGARDTVCSVLRQTDARGRTTLSTWAGEGPPRGASVTAPWTCLAKAITRVIGLALGGLDVSGSRAAQEEQHNRTSMAALINRRIILPQSVSIYQEHSATWKDAKPGPVMIAINSLRSGSSVHCEV